MTDGFETGSFSSGWGITNGVAIIAAGGANNSTNFAGLAAFASASGRELGARLDDVAPDGAQGFDLEFSFRIRGTIQRQFHLQVSTSTAAVSSGAPALSVRYQSGWSAYDGSNWQPISGLGNVTTNQWYRLQVTGQGWGTPSARFTLKLSDAGTTNFTSSATNITWFQSGNPTSNPARYFIFTTVYGNDPGFDVDEVFAAVTATPPTVTNAILNISGIYPHLAVFSTEGEIGIGAVMPWANRLWFVTYPPHAAGTSLDKLWTVNSNLTLVARPESVGGTHADRMIHSESQQLIIGPYFVDTNANVRVVSRTAMSGRLTAVARSLTAPTQNVYFFTMEDGFYEVDVNTLAVTTIYRDGNVTGSASPLAPYPGTHGKGGYTGQGRVLFANNGEPGWSITNDPDFNGPSGVLTEHVGTNWIDHWNTVERREFTEITGPGGIYGNANDSDPIWSLGWDKRSVILKLLDNGTWYAYRLPKASYSYDAMHGWYTEWPRIREIVDGKWLMNMHGMFYYFPETFTAAGTAGIQPICTCLKMPDDFCWWNGQLVMGRDDASMTESEGTKWNGESNSGLWFGQLSDLRNWGAPEGFGGPWVQDKVTANKPSDPFLITGFTRRIVHIRQGNLTPVNFALQYDCNGTGNWQTLTNLSIPASGYAWFLIPPTLNAIWMRLAPDQDATNVTAYYDLANAPTPPAPALFAGIADARSNDGCSDGIIRSQSGDARTLQFAENTLDSNGGITSTGYYEINGDLQLTHITNTAAEITLRTACSLSKSDFTMDAASILYTEGTNRFRLPKGLDVYSNSFASGWPRGVREVVTERNLFDAGGTFYELPRADAGGFRRIRPVATHNKHISDFTSWRGLFVIAGVSSGATNDGHVFRSDDGQTALWFGDIDDLWRMGRPTGIGGPWKNSAVAANMPSDPYLMYGYEHKTLSLSHTSTNAVTFTVEVDVMADNTWSTYSRFTVPLGQTFRYAFPDGYSAHWVRLLSDTTTTATATFTYSSAAPQIVGVNSFGTAGVQLTFIGEAGQSYSIHASQDITLPLANWPVIATGVFDASPVVYKDANPANYLRRFYVVSTP